MTILDGMTARQIETPRITVNVLERTHDDVATAPERTLVFVHGQVSSSLIWQELMQDLPPDMRVIAVDLRGFGATENAPVDATRGVRDFSDDLHAALEALDARPAHLIGWALGAAVAMQYALEHPVLSLTLESPISPYGFGATRRDGTRLTDDDAGAGAGVANPDFVERLIAGDTSTDAPTSPRSVFRAAYVAPGYTSENEDIWVEAMLSTSTATGNYPGETVPSDNWPGFAPGTIGVMNALAPRYFDVSGIVEIDPKPPILWIRGTEDAVVSDTSFFDAGYLGEAGIIPDWPGAEVAPAQQMVSQTRDVFARYSDNGGIVTELALEGVGHTPHLERPAEVRRALLRVIGYVDRPADPAPPTEAIILKSAD